MITEQHKDKVFFSQWLRTDYPNIYKDVCEILDANNLNFRLICSDNASCKANYL